MSSGFMRIDEPVVIIRRYVRPFVPGPEYEKLKSEKSLQAYRAILRKVQCITCVNVATQQLCLDCDGAIKVEKYCDNCIKNQKVT